MPNPNTPFAGLLTDTDVALRNQGSPIPDDFDSLSQEQQQAADQLIRDMSTRDIYDQLVSQSRAVNNVNRIIGGIKSDDILFNVDPQTGESDWQIIPKEESATGGDADADLPAVTWSDRYKVLAVTVVSEVEQTVAWGVDYVRSVAETEE